MSVIPVVMVTAVVVPFFMTLTVCLVPVVVMASEGTAKAFLAVAVVTEMFALWPSRRSAGGFLMEIVTG